MFLSILFLGMLIFLFASYWYLFIIYIYSETRAAGVIMLLFSLFFDLIAAT